MRKNILMVLFGMIFLLMAVLNSVSSEIYLFNDVSVSNITNTTDFHAFYKLIDTSDGFRWRNKGVLVEFDYLTQALPFVLVSGSVDWCNLTFVHYANDYDNDGNYIGTNTSIVNYYFTNGSNSGTEKFNLKDADEVSADMICHYTNQSEIYIDNILAGSLTTYIPSYECKGCTEFTLEELSNEIERSDEITESELKIYDISETIISFNYRLWLYGSWIIRLFLLIGAIGLIFSAVYYIYKFLVDIKNRI